MPREPGFLRGWDEPIIVRRSRWGPRSGARRGPVPDRKRLAARDCGLSGFAVWVLAANRRLGFSEEWARGGTSHGSFHFLCSFAPSLSLFLHFDRLLYPRAGCLLWFVLLLLSLLCGIRVVSLWSLSVAPWLLSLLPPWARFARTSTVTRLVSAQSLTAHALSAYDPFKTNRIFQSHSVSKIPTSHQTATMKPSLFFSVVLPVVAVAQQQEAQQPQQQTSSAALNPSPSLPNVTPPFPQQQYPQAQSSQGRGFVDVAAAQPTDTDVNRTSSGSGRSTTKTKSLQARSEGTLGQSPWIGMAIGLTCTALAAVTLG